MNTKMLSLSLVLCAGCVFEGEEFVELEPTDWSFTVETIRNNCPEEVMEEVGTLSEQISIKRRMPAPDAPDDPTERISEYERWGGNRLRAGHILPYYELLDLNLSSSNYLIHTHLFLGQDLQGFLIKTADCGKYICQLEGRVSPIEIVK